MRGLASGRPRFADRFREDAAGALATLGRDDVPLLYWTGVSWSLLVAGSADDPAAIADLPKCEALVRRALALDESYDRGAIHEYFVAFEGSRPEAMGGSASRARKHFERAVALSGGKRVSPYVTMAETVSVRAQDRAGFLSLLDRALSFDAEAGPAEYRLANLVAQRKARWLKGRADDLFLE
jgi:predicted anti-sigma-YlaC factor YlaD